MLSFPNSPSFLNPSDLFKSLKLFEMSLTGTKPNPPTERSDLKVVQNPPTERSDLKVVQNPPTERSDLKVTLGQGVTFVKKCALDIDSRVSLIPFKYSGSGLLPSEEILSNISKSLEGKLSKCAVTFCKRLYYIKFVEKSLTDEKKVEVIDLLTDELYNYVAYHRFMKLALNKNLLQNIRVSYYRMALDHLPAYEFASTSISTFVEMNKLTGAREWQF